MDSRGSSSVRRESKTSFHDGVLEVVAVEGVLHLGQIQVGDGRGGWLALFWIWCLFFMFRVRLRLVLMFFSFFFPVWFACIRFCLVCLGWFS